MRRQLPHDAEIFAGADNASAEYLLPEAVHGHARHERILWPNNPPGETEPVLGQVRRQGRQSVRRIWLDRVTALVVLTSEQHIGHRLPRPLLHDMSHRAARFHGGFLLLQEA